MRYSISTVETGSTGNEETDMNTTELRISAAGGNTWHVTAVSGDEREFLGSLEIDSTDEVEVADAAREEYGYDDDVPARVVG